MPVVKDKGGAAAFISDRSPTSNDATCNFAQNQISLNVNFL